MPKGKQGKKKKPAPVPAAKGRKQAKPKKKSSRFASIGKAIGSVVAPGVGGVVGGLAGSAVDYLYGKISGSGDYTVKKNSLVGVTNVPSFGENTFRMRAREYITDIFGSTGFQNRTYVINPGNSSLFPWLSTIATRYQMYEIHGMMFEFVSTSATALNSTNTALGKVIMATSYNASALPFEDVKSALITQFSNMGKPADNLVHAVECKRESAVLDNLYVRANSTTVDDPKFYDYGLFQLITSDMQAVADIGGLWVSYDITLSKPTLDVSAASIPSQTYSNAGMSGGWALFGLEGPSEPDVNITWVSTSTTVGAVAFNNPIMGAKYLFDFHCSGPSMTVPTISTTVYDGIVGSTYYPQYINGGADTKWVARICFQITSTVPSDDLGFIGFKWTLNTAFANGWSGKCLVVRLNDQTPISAPSVLLGASRLDKLKYLVKLSELRDRDREEDKKRVGIMPEIESDEVAPRLFRSRPVAYVQSSERRSSSAPRKPLALDEP